MSFVAQHGVENDQQLAHAGGKCRFGMFAPGAQAQIEGFDGWIAADSRHRRHVQYPADLGASAPDATTAAQGTAPALEIEVRQLDAALSGNIQSAAQSISKTFNELQSAVGRSYLLIDLGSRSDRRWLTSRLYLLAFLITLIDRSIYLVFVETVRDIRNRYIGTASPDRLRWALARHYPWLESAMVTAFAVVGGAYCDSEAREREARLKVPKTSNLRFNPATGHLDPSQVNELMQSFLRYIREQPDPKQPLQDPEEWITLQEGVIEHAKWTDGGRIERLLGQNLSTSSVVLLPNQNPASLGTAVLGQQGSYVAVLETDRTFRSMADRAATVELLASWSLKQARSETYTRVEQ